MSSIGSGFTLTENTSSSRSEIFDEFLGFVNPPTNYSNYNFDKSNLNDFESTVLTIAGDVDKRLCLLESNTYKDNDIKSTTNVYWKKFATLNIAFDALNQRVTTIENQLKHFLDNENIENLPKNSVDKSFDHHEKFDDAIKKMFQQQNNFIARSKYFRVKTFYQIENTLKFSKDHTFTRVFLFYKSDSKWYLSLTDDDDLEKKVFPLNDLKMNIKTVKIQGFEMVSIKDSKKKYYLLFEKNDINDFNGILNNIK